jgi:hypothetical protein
MDVNAADRKRSKKLFRYWLVYFRIRWMIFTLVESRRYQDRNQCQGDFFKTPAEKESGKILPDAREAEGFLRGRRRSRRHSKNNTGFNRA